MSTLALSFFAAADTTTDNNDIIEIEATPWNAGRFDGLMLTVLMVVIGIASANTMADTDLNTVQDGIESFSHYHK